MKWGFSKNDKVSIIFDHVTIYPKCFFFLIINKLEKKEKEKKKVSCDMVLSSNLTLTLFYLSYYIVIT